MSFATWLSSTLRSLLAPDNLLANPFLVASITPENTIPLSALQGDRGILSPKISPDQILAACHHIGLALWPMGLTNYAIQLPYVVSRHELAFGGLDIAREGSEFCEFVTRLAGPGASLDFRCADPLLILRIEDPHMLFGIWRALKLIQFNSRLVDVRMNHSIPDKRIQTRGILIERPLRGKKSISIKVSPGGWMAERWKPQEVGV